MSRFLAFNRTSMESKHQRHTPRELNNHSLLIEPVWNRNIAPLKSSPLNSPFNRTSMESKHICWVRSVSRHVTFNRTSMESKPLMGSPSRSMRSPFNRTSMESKLWIDDTDSEVVHTFNRTSMESKRAPVNLPCHKNCLLIEPVWNRNASLSVISTTAGRTFNRTSMESKHATHLPYSTRPYTFNRTSMESKLGRIADAADYFTYF